MSFYDDKEDNIMNALKDYLFALKDVKDVREINKKTFGLTELFQHDLPRFVKYYYEDEKSDDEEDEECLEENPEAKVEPLTCDSPRTKALRRKSMTLLMNNESDLMFESKVRITRKTQVAVANELVKYQESLPLFLKAQSGIL